MKAFFENRGGAAAVEFALIAPIMVLMYFGMAEITQGLLANRRASHVTTALGDLVAQYSSLTESQVTDIFLISNQLMAPMPAGDISMRISSIAIDADGVAKVRWSRVGGATGLTRLDTDATVTVPEAFSVANEALVRADTEFVYKSPVKQVLKNDITFKHTIYLKPRSTVPVELK